MIFLNENKSKDYNESIRKFIDEKFYKKLFVSKPSTFFSVNLNLKPTFENKRLNEIDYFTDFKHFMNRLNYKIFKNSFKRFNKRLTVIPILEKTKCDSFHYHSIIEKPNRISDDEFKKIVKEQYKKMRFSFDDQNNINFYITRQTKQISSFSFYTTKRRNYNIVDFSNLYI